MSIRSKMKFGGGLPVGGRSSGGRPKKKVKAKLRKSYARQEAETDVRSRLSDREARKRMKEENQMSKTNLARSPQRQKAAKRHLARKSASAARKPGTPGDTKAYYNKDAAKLNEAADKISASKVAARRKSARSYSSTDRSRPTQEAGKDLIKARKKLANTPRFGGKGRFSSGTRNRFVRDAD